MQVLARRVALIAALAVAGVLFLGTAGCAQGGRLRADVTELMETHGVRVSVIAAEAPASSRSGLLELQPDPAAEASIVREFSLLSLEPDDPRLEQVIARVPGNVALVWGVQGRPPQLKLSDGGQFETFYLVTTTDDRTYLLVEYAYG